MFDLAGLFDRMLATPLFVGRSDQLDRLQLLVGTQDDPLRILLVAAPAGWGKSRLLREASALLVGAGHTVVSTAFEPGHGYRPWLSVTDALGMPYREDPSLSTDERRWDAANSIGECLRHRAPVVVILDDLHHANESERWILDQLARRHDLLGVTFIGASRTSLQGEAGRNAIVVDVPPLSVDEVGELIAGTGQEVSALDLHSCSGGNPLFVHAVLRNPGAGENPLTGLIAAADRKAATLVALLALSPDAPSPVIAHAIGDGSAAIFDVFSKSDASGLTRNGRLSHELVGEAALTHLGAAERCELESRLAEGWRTAGDAIRATRHALRAVPAIDAAAAIDDALQQDSLPLDVARSLVSVCETHIGHDRLRTAQALLLLADALWNEGSVEASIAAANRAAGVLREGDDPLLRAKAEIAALRRHDYFRPDPARVQRLLALADEAADPSVRAATLGRAAVLLTANPSTMDDAFRVGDRAVEAAEKAPIEALVQALIDRHFCVIDRSGADARETAAAQIIQRTRDPELALVGHQWQFGARLARGDLDGATAALDEWDLLASLRPKPDWRLAIDTRRASLLALRVGLEPARDLLMSARARYDGQHMSEEERLGTEFEHRRTLARLYGRDTDDVVEAFQHVSVLVPDAPPVPFIQIRHALGDLLLGRHDRARGVALHWAPRADQVRDSFLGLPTLAALSHLVVDLELAEVAGTVAESLNAFAGRLPIDNGVGLDLPVDALRARLLALMGEHEAASSAAASGVAFARAMNAPPLLSWCLVIGADIDSDPRMRAEADAIASRVGVLLPRSKTRAATQPGRRAQLSRTADGWSFETPYGTAKVADSLGMRYLATLLSTPGEVGAFVLAGGGDVVRSPDVGPALDARAKREYRTRIADLEAAIDEASAARELERESKARVELEFLMSEIRSAIGLGGRDRPQRSDDERARVNVTRALRRAIGLIQREIPELGAHLDRSITTGRFCSYDPEPASRLDWRVRH